MMGMIRLRLAVAGLAVALGGCVTMAPPAPAVLSLVRNGCADAPDLGAALSLTPEKEKALHIVSGQVGSATPCLRSGGRDTPYLLYSLPADAGDKTLTVGGYLEPLRILSPAVSVLDARGQATRTFGADEFLYRNLIYSVLFRPRPDERFVLVTVDADRVGKAYDSIAIGVNTSSTYTPAGPIMISTGMDNAQSRVFSYEGAVQVVVNDSDTKEAVADGT